MFQKFMAKLLEHEKVKPLLSDEHFSVDGTLIGLGLTQEPSSRSAPRMGMTTRTFTVRCARTHASKHDRPEAKLYRKADGREVLGRINDHKITDLADLLRWNWCRPIPVDRAA